MTRSYPLPKRPPHQGWRARLHEIIFEADTPAGKAFDVALILLILASVAAVMLDSIASVRERYGSLLLGLEWVFTILFTVEYVLRLVTIGRPMRYATSFYGVIDLLAVLPTYLDLLFPGTRVLLVIRILRVLRVFRVLKLVQFLGEASVLRDAIRRSRTKIAIFLFTVLTVVVVLGSILYLIEGEEAGFTSIPRAVYWAIVTLTTVGYGDISPRTALGQAVAAAIMIIGYAIIAVPTGIFTVEMTQASRRQVTTQSCPECSREGHDPDAVHCKYCGAAL